MFWGTRASFRTYNPMESARIPLNPQAVEAIARRVVELLERRGLTGGRELVDAAELARRFGIERSWVYSHAIELGAVELGGGRRRGCALILESPRGCSGGWGRDQRPTRPPARVSGRVSRECADAEVSLLPVRGQGDELTAAAAHG